MSRHTVQKIATASVLVALGTSPLYVSSAVGAATAARSVAYGGSAYGSSASLGTLVRSGPSAALPMCTRRAPYAHTNTSAALSLPGLGAVGAVSSHVASTRSGATRTASVSTYTGRTRLLAGLISADAVRTGARVSLSGSTYHTSGTTEFVHLRIAGRALAATATANKQVTLAGVGTVVLNHQSSSAGRVQRVKSVDALVLHVNTHNIANLPAGTVVIGHSAASLHTPTYRRPYGSAYATTVHVGSQIRSGRTAAAYLPCGGSDSANRTNATAAVQVAGLITTGAATSTARSVDQSASTTAGTQSRITHVSLLAGRVKINAVTTRARVASSGSHLTRSAAGTTLAGLVVNGIAQKAPTLHTARTLAGIGTLTLGRIITTTTGLQVYGAQLTLTHTIGTATAGTVITIGAASAGVTSG